MTGRADARPGVTTLARTVAAAGVMMIAAAACTSGVDRSAALVEQGDPAAGRETMRDVGCMSCHRVPGSSGPDAFVGPPLDAWSRRSFIAGTVPNDAANLERWLADPQSIRPGTAMPTLPLTESEIDDIVAFLFSLD